jgi:hypothetical protein
MEPRLAIYVVAVVTALVASVAAMVDQSTKLIDIHEIPPFVSERVELSTGSSAHRTPKDGGAQAPGPASGT